MATIKAIEGQSVHQIQSGQVIVDIVSVIKELVENSLDGRASKITVNLKNYGLDSIEVQDDGNGIALEDFPTVALKHYTSKLANFEELDTLQTFGFRGEALSSLCALANVHIVTARAQDGAIGHRLDFEKSGKLRGRTVTAAQKGTIVSVENIFHSLPVRRKDLEKNCKREWSKVLSFMYSYACIGIGVRFSISNQPAKGKKNTAFSTQGNATTRENIANVFGAKTLAFLIELDLKLELQPTNSRLLAESPDGSRHVRVQGHISRPAFGEGRQTPDRQMYFVNSRPCLLPQISKVFNEVYKSFNHHQSPFVLANFIMDTNAYDVNVSPDKRTIMLHDQTMLLETLKMSLMDLFQNADHTMPQSQLPAQRLPPFKPPSLSRTATMNTTLSREDNNMEDESPRSRVCSRASSTASVSGDLIESWAGRDSTMRPQKRGSKKTKETVLGERRIFEGPQFTKTARQDQEDDEILLEDEPVQHAEHTTETADSIKEPTHHPEQDPESMAYDEVFLRTPPRPPGTQKTAANPLAPTSGKHDTALLSSRIRRNSMSSTQSRSQRSSQREPDAQEGIPSSFNILPKVSAGPINDAFARMRARRPSDESTEITIGGTTRTTVSNDWSNKRRRIHTPKGQLAPPGPGNSAMLSQNLLNFAAPGSQLALSTHSMRTGIYSEHSNSEAELIDEDESSMQSDQESVTASVNRTAYDLGLMESNTAARGPSDADDVAMDAVETDEEEKLREDEVVARLIQNAERPMLQRKSGTTQRSVMANGYGGKRKELTYDLRCTLHLTIDEIRRKASLINKTYGEEEQDVSLHDDDDGDAEAKLSLTINKADFQRMTIVGQFNLGFILAVRPASTEGNHDELFIIDQHAADEKSNYERLQKTVKLQSQPLVQPKVLQLTAIEEEVVSNHSDALKANGFEIDICEGDDNPGDRAYHLLTLPTSQQTTFKLADLEELMHLLSEISIDSSEIPRPRKVQKMLAMRACRSSIMVGKTLTMKQMTKVVQHMGEMEKPWNCPHGRPTMRHLTSLGSWQSYHEAQHLTGEAVSNEDGRSIWERWMQ
ncbi:hypothetical protein AMS68_006314 [Peltaster fructicola]|uniref:DNA mismatch repair protein PMS1 n=1 Tax=Peltaster fructicola TaxID=286661 RepID=A0A6H0Y1D8_9PEZI|nr:hypothetical protein AMS68_006314 [Peltaster fructicola]